MNVVERLAARAGAWRGTNRLHDPHTGGPSDSVSTLQITPLLGGWFARLDYIWDYQGTPQEGLMLVACDPKANTTAVHWIDTWHYGRSVMVLSGASASGEIATVRGTYPAPPDPDWSWRIDIDVASPGTIRITMYNVSPANQDSIAVEAVYSKV